jgi:hypothetical protein
VQNRGAIEAEPETEKPAGHVKVDVGLNRPILEACPRFCFFFFFTSLNRAKNKLRALLGTKLVV